MRKPRISFPLVLFLSSWLIVPACSADIAKGRQLASVQCSPCHGVDGLSKLPEAPNLAGQVEPYLAQQIDAYKSGARKNDMMSLVVKQLSDSDVADLAAYYAAIEINVGKIPGQ